MIQRISRKKFNIFAFDIETHNDIESIQKKETSMWLGCLINEESKIDDESCYFYNMQDVIDKLRELSTPKRKHNESRKCKNVCVFIYNASFEWSFVLPYLIKNGFKWKENIEQDDEFVYNSVSTRSCSSVWECKIKFTKKSGIILFRDLAKMYGGGLGKVAKSFNLPTQKGEIDYRKNRLHNYIVSKEEKEYCFKDTRIIIDILLKILEKNDKDFWNTMSMASYSMKKLIKTGYPRSTHPYREYRKEYPELDKDETEFLRRSVSGGITYAPSRWQFKDIKHKILHIDAHQMHPTQCYKHLFPYGYGEKFIGKPPKARICACRIKISYDDVLLHSVIQLIGLDFVEDYELVVWDFEIPTMKKVYVNLKIQYIDGYAYKCKPVRWRKFYADNYNARLIAKKNKDDFNILYYKLLNNSSYGKHLEKPHNTLIANKIDELGIITSDVYPKEDKDISTNAKYTYLGFSCIPAYSRVNLIETALLFGYEKVLYFDTDSIFCIYDEETKNIWETKIDHTDFLGGWAIEEISDRAQFTAPKRYKLEIGDKVVIKAGGINFNQFTKEKALEYAEVNKIAFNSEDEEKDFIKHYQVPFDELNIVSETYAVQRAYRVKGGTIIEFQNKDLSIQKKYLSIAKRNGIDI